MALLLLVQTATSLVMTSFGPLAPFLLEDLDISRAKLGMLTSASNIGTVLFGIFSGWLIDRFGVRRFLLIGPCIIGLFFAAFAKSHLFWLAIFLVFVGGVGYVLINPLAAKGLTCWFSPRSRATAIGIMKSGVNLGTALGGVALPTLSLMLGWQNALTIFALVPVVLGMLGIAIYRDPPSRASLEVPALGLGELRRVITNRGILLLGALWMIYAAVQFGILTFLILFLKEVILLPLTIAGMLLTVAALSGAVGRVLWGIISDRVFGGERKPVLFIIGLLTASMTIAMALLAPGTALWLICVIVAILGFSAMGWAAVVIAFLAEIGGREQAGSAVGVGMAIASVGVMFAPPVFGYIVDTTHSYRIAWVIFGILAAMGAMLALAVKAKRQV